MPLNVSRFKNIDGVSCYMISILHILQIIPEFVKFIKNINLDNFNNNQVIFELAKLIKISLGNTNILLFNTLKKLLGEKNEIWSNMEQQDSQEFFTFIICQLEEEYGSKVMFIPKLLDNNQLNCNSSLLEIMSNHYINQSIRKDYSSIKDLFFGYLNSNTTCSFCGSKSTCFESFLTLSLSIPINKNKNINQIYKLEDCLDNFTKLEKLDKHNKMLCEICGIKNQSLKNIALWKLPKILVIHLKRFVINNYGIPISKIVNPVLYPVDEFDLSDYIDDESPYKSNCKYKLIGINIHMAQLSINYGHYISIIRNIKNDKWYILDDSNKPTKIDLTDIQDRNAYLLFYIQI